LNNWFLISADWKASLLGKKRLADVGFDFKPRKSTYTEDTVLSNR
jgi:hypothetical protein